jgi:O-antigen/teichoic acid export membrane protein
MVSKVPSFFLIFIAPLALLRLDILILGFVQGDAAVGIYSAAMRFLTVCLIVPDGIMTASFALLSKLSGADTTDRFDVLVQKTIAWLGAGLMPISVLLALLASFVTSLLFGGKFVSAVSPARTLAWALVPFAVNRALGDAMVARGFQRTVAKIILSNFLVAAALYVSFIWLWGVDGAAWAFYTSILLFCFISVGCAIRKASLRPYTELAFSLFPAMICSLIFALSKSTMVCSITGVLASGLALIPAFRLLDRPFHSTTIDCSSLSVETQ